VAYWQNLGGRDFEREVANLLSERGYQVQLTPATNDGGVDLMLARGGQSILVQCKAHKNPVGLDPFEISSGHLGGSEAWLVSLSGFTNGS
jgi:restriction system protein